MGVSPPEASLQNRAIRELMGYNLWAYSFMSPRGMMDALAPKMPGMADALKSMTEELSRNKSVMLRTRMSMYVPLPPAVLQQMAAQNPGAAPVDPAAPMFEMKQEAVEVSSASVDEAAFRVPEDFKATPPDDLLKTMFAAPAKP